MLPLRSWPQELAFDRFLRRLVRVLVATAVREAVGGATAQALLQLSSIGCVRTQAITMLRPAELGTRESKRQATDMEDGGAIRI